MSQPVNNKFMITLPSQLFIEAKLESHALADVAGEATARIDAALSGYDWGNRRVAVAAGSRGIDRIPIVVRSTVDWLKSRGAIPFVFPAMGSHGGGTPQGQREVLAALGITEESIGTRIEDSTETIELGSTPNGFRVLTSRVAYEANAVLLINRVKPHTDFVSTEIGSGLRKMCVIGLGKVDGAFEFHRAASLRGYEGLLKEASSFIIEKYPALFGLALVEDAHHHLAYIEAMRGEQIVAREPELFAMSARWMPSLPFKEIDVLVVDEIGKNISGAGMDTNIIERGIDGLPRQGHKIEVGAIYARSLTKESHGNAIGIGFADVASTRLIEAIDKEATYTNALSAITPATVRIPMHFSSDAECLKAALRIAGANPQTARILRIRNTLTLDRFTASASYADEISGRKDLSILQSREEWFSSDGTLV
jgi:hypothetical protein